MPASLESRQHKACANITGEKKRRRTAVIELDKCLSFYKQSLIELHGMLGQSAAVKQTRLRERPLFSRHFFLSLQRHASLPAYVYIIVIGWLRPQLLALEQRPRDASSSNSNTK